MPVFQARVREYTLELSDSVSNLSLHFSVVCFRQFSKLPGEVSFDLGFSVVDTLCWLCQVVRQLISHSNHCIFEPSLLSSGLGNPRSVDRLIINRRLNLFCALTCAVGHAGWGGSGPRVRCHQGCSGGFYLPAGVLSQRNYPDLSACYQSVPAISAVHLYHPPRSSRPVLITPGTGPSPRCSNQDLFVARRPVERVAVGIDSELVIVDTVGAQPISTVHFLIKGISQALLLGLKFCLSPRRVKILSPDVLSSCWTRGGSGSTMASGRSRL